MAKAPWHAVCQRAFLIPSNFKLTYYLKSYLGGLVLFALLLVRYSSFHSLFHSVNRLVDTVWGSWLVSRGRLGLLSVPTPSKQISK